MMNSIKLATPEQVERIRDKSDLEVGSAVYAFGENLAVVRTQTRLDPVVFDEATPISQRLLFVWGLETAMRLNHVPAYYFAIDSADEKWSHVVETNGAERIHEHAVFEYKKILL